MPISPGMPCPGASLITGLHFIIVNLIPEMGDIC